MHATLGYVVFLSLTCEQLILYTVTCLTPFLAQITMLLRFLLNYVFVSHCMSGSLLFSLLCHKLTSHKHSHFSSNTFISQACLFSASCLHLTYPTSQSHSSLQALNQSCPSLHATNQWAFPMLSSDWSPQPLRQQLREEQRRTSAHSGPYAEDRAHRGPYAEDAAGGRNKSRSLDNLLDDVSDVTTS